MIKIKSFFWINLKYKRDNFHIHKKKKLSVQKLKIIFDDAEN